jgi:uncharacterized protein YbjT (DUF2867 family)
MARILITGGTGALGTDLIARLAQTPHTIRITSRKPKPADARTEWAQVDFETQIGFSEALRDVDVVVHCMTSSLNSEKADVIGTQRFLADVKQAKVKNFIFISIVGTDRIPYSYYQHKVIVEKAIKESGVPYSIVRAAQFHGFIDMLLGLTKKLWWMPILPLPTNWQFQTIDTRDVATYLMPFIEKDATGRIDNVAGPQMLRLGEMARQWRDIQGSHKPIVRLPLFGKVAHGFDQGYNTAPDKAYGSITWADYLHEKYARGEEKTHPRPHPTP